MSSSFVASGMGRRSALVVAAAITVALTLSLVNVAESSAGYPQAVTAKKKCKKGKKSAVASKKCKKKKKPVVAPPPAPLPLTDGEVINQIGQKAGVYCAQDLDCTGAFGYYSLDPAGTQAECSSKSTYSWACFGFYDGDDGTDTYTCDFREIVERDGFNGIKSHLDLSFSGDGFFCFVTSP
jgi:hypothetical protein